MSCNGIFAGINRKKSLKILEMEKFTKIINVYMKSKDNYVKNLVFNREKISMSFGKLILIIVLYNLLTI